VEHLDRSDDPLYDAAHMRFFVHAVADGPVSSQFRFEWETT